MDLHAGRAGARTQMALANLQLIRSRRVGAVTYHRLLAEHGSAEAALAALPDIARAAGLTEYHVCPAEVARHEMSPVSYTHLSTGANAPARNPAALSSAESQFRSVMPPPVLPQNGQEPQAGQGPAERMKAHP